MLNKVILIGRLTRDPELRYLPSGVGVATFTLAVDRNYTNRQGEREADFIPIVVWRTLAETCAKYLSKGRLVAVAGRIQTRSYETPEGVRRYVTEVVADEVRFLDRAERPAEEFHNDVEPKDFPANIEEEDTSVSFHPIEGEDDELPF